MGGGSLKEKDKKFGVKQCVPEFMHVFECLAEKSRKVQCHLRFCFFCIITRLPADP